VETQAKRDGSAPPYVSWHTFLGVIERMEPPGIVPTQIDPTFLKTYAGSVQRLLLHAFRSLGLIDPEAGQVREPLKALVDQPEERPRLIRQLIEIHYPWALALDGNATEQQLLDAFAEHAGVEGETRRKAVAFFLAAAEYAQVPYSPLWKKSRGRPRSAGSAPSRKSGNRRSKRTTPIEPGQDVPRNGPNVRPVSRDEMVAAYFDLLLTKARQDQKIDADLADRMEALLGVAKDKPSRRVAGKTTERQPESEGQAEGASA
jgi:hypothetical protein